MPDELKPMTKEQKEQYRVSVALDKALAEYLLKEKENLERLRKNTPKMKCPLCGGIVRGSRYSVFCSDCEWYSDVD